MTAIPLVKPVTTGYGMNLIAPPNRARPMDHEQDARHQRADRQSVDAVLCDDAVDDHDERARRPADLDAASAEKRDQEPGHDGGDRGPSRASTPEAIAKAIASGIATMPTTTPGLEIGGQLAARVIPARVVKVFGSHAVCTARILRAIRSGGYPGGCCC